MERKLIKAAIYGFIIGLCVTFLFYPDVRVTNIGDGSIIEQHVPVREMILDLLRSSIRTSIAFDSDVLDYCLL